MPTYVYRREDGTKFEIKQRITEDPLEECPETGQPVERIIAGSAGLIFKGDGFYITDYGKDDAGRRADSTAENSASSESEAASGDNTSTESASASSETTGDSSAKEAA